MSKLEELIKELCPNGVEYKKLGELGIFLSGLSGKSKSDFTNGNAKFITYKNVYSNPALKIDVEDTVKITDNEKQTTLQYGDVIFTGSSETPDECGFSSIVTTHINEKIYLNSFCFIFRFNDLGIIEPNFAKHLFRSDSLRYQIGKTASGVTRYNVSKDKMKQVQIPLPPLAVQREIVHILDKFTLLSAELTAELTARRKQYDFYRDKLLTFDFNISWFKLDQVCYIKNGYTPSKSNMDFWEKGNIPWVRLEDIRLNGRYIYDTIQHITPIAVKNKKLFLKDSVIISTTATIGEYAMLMVDALTNQQITCLTIKEDYKSLVIPKYLFYYSSKISEWCKNNANQGGGLAIVSLEKLKNYDFPIPPLDVQERIVNILDNFDTICSDLGIGLPAEIEKRQQQYEYYRDKLLTFDLSPNTIYQTDRQTDLIRLFQYVFGYAFVKLEDVAKYSNARIEAEKLNANIYVGVDNLLPERRGKEQSSYVPTVGRCIVYNVGDTLIGNIRPYLKKIWLADCVGGTNGDVLVIQAKINFILPKFLYYVLSSDKFFAFDMQHSKGAKMPRGNKDEILKYIFALPPLEEQKRIVEVLDRFDKLCNDISEGLPAEIEARQKQYEHYRDELLSFKKLDT